MALRSGRGHAANVNDWVGKGPAIERFGRLREMAALLESSNIGIHALILDDQGVVQLLKAAIEREGSISAFAKRHGLGRSYLSNVLNGKRPVSSPLVRALGFRKVYAPQHDN
jgi:hypothetical protein